jgi:glycosyltransferase involved in cell wall biosynthesis
MIQESRTLNICLGQITEEWNRNQTDSNRSGSYLQNLKSLLRWLNLENNVVFLSRVSNEVLADVIACACINLHCSMSEGWGLSVLEATSAGTPPVAYRIPGISNSVMENETEMLAEDSNVDQLASFCESAIKPPYDLFCNCRSLGRRYGITRQ